MSLGIKSIWRARARGSALTGPCLISRDPMPSRVPNLQLPTPRFESTSTPSSTSLDATSPPNAFANHTNRRFEHPRAIDRRKKSSRVDDPPESKNRIFKRAFKIKADLVDESDKRAHYPVTGQPRKYPNESATLESLNEHQKDVRRQVGHGIVWGYFGKQAPEWKDCFQLMRKMSPEESEGPKMSAVRIILPKTWTAGTGNLNLEYVDSATGVLQKLRASVDQNPSAVILRGRSGILSKAVDDVVRYCPEAKVYQLGDVAALDYNTKQLWPAIEGATNDGTSPQVDEDKKIWMHKENEPYEIKEPYEQIPKPQEWTQENFETYITTLSYGRIPAHLAIKFYGQRKVNGRNVDTDGIRIRLIADAFEDANAHPFITAPVLKMAVSMMADKGGHRASANRLIVLGEKLGIPMDTETYNIMLEGYVLKRDLVFFNGFLRRMEARYFQPNIRTWLLFLQLTRGESEKKQIIVTMYELGMLQHPDTRRGIASVMASLDAYAALRAGKTLDAFLADQKERYGKDWLSVAAANSIITELLRFHRPEDPRINDAKRLVEIQTEAGLSVETNTINIFLKNAATARDWNTALWAMSLLEESGCELNQDTYALLISLAINTRSPHALGTVYFYGILHRKLKKASRQMISQILLRLHRDEFWKRWECQPTIFPKEVIATLEDSKISTGKAIMSRLERIILDEWEGYVPFKHLAHSLELAYRSNDSPLRRQLKNPQLNEDGTPQPIQVQDLVLKLRRLDGEPGNINVRLKGRFNPKTMVEGWIDEDSLLEQDPSTDDDQTAVFN